MNAHPRLGRSETDRIIAGVCAGIAATLRTSTTLIRLLWACLTLLGAVGLLLYLLLWLTLPTESAPGHRDASSPGKAWRRSVPSSKQRAAADPGSLSLHGSPLSRVTAGPPVSRTQEPGSHCAPHRRERPPPGRHRQVPARQRRADPVSAPSLHCASRARAAGRIAPANRGGDPRTSRTRAPAPCRMTIPDQGAPSAAEPCRRRHARRARLLDRHARPTDGTQSLAHPGHYGSLPTCPSMAPGLRSWPVAACEC